jgi:tripartite-type tricarboxylate transporter receptor subunit TctC
MRLKPASQLIALLMLAGLGAGTAVQAADYPSKPIRFLVGVSPGGGTDFVARMVGQRLSEAWGQPVVVDNRPGATGLIGMEMLSKSQPDGYTVIVFNVGHMMSPYLVRKVAFDPVRDFTPVSLLANGTTMLGIHPSLPARSVKELVALAKKQPGRINYASGGSGGIQHLTTELFKHAAGVDLVHVPYKGSGPGTLALLSGQVSVFMTNILALLPHVESGKVVGLAVTGSKRNPSAPAVPTFAEAGYPKVDVSLWQGIFAPGGTPKDIVDKLSGEVGRIVRTPEVGRILAAQGAEPAGSTPAEFGRLVVSERKRWLEIVRVAGIKSYQ